MFEGDGLEVDLVLHTLIYLVEQRLRWPLEIDPLIRGLVSPHRQLLDNVCKLGLFGLLEAQDGAHLLHVSFQRSLQLAINLQALHSDVVLILCPISCILRK